MTIWKLPNWFIVALQRLIPCYRRGWADLERRSQITGTARESMVTFRAFGYAWVREREIAPNPAKKKLD
jgi:hypothetical protein